MKQAGPITAKAASRAAARQKTILQRLDAEREKLVTKLKVNTKARKKVEEQLAEFQQTARLLSAAVTRKAQKKQEKIKKKEDAIMRKLRLKSNKFKGPLDAAA